MATASGPSDVLQPSDGKTRFVRLARLLRCGGTKVMREFFDYKIPPANLVAKLSHPSVEARLRHMKSNRILTDPQWQKLYPSSSAGPVQSTAFDITLLFTLLRENVISGLSPPSTGWNMLPNIHDCSLPADMARIKYYRNFIAHGDETMELSEQDFSDYWTEIKEALVRIVEHYAASGSSTARDWETAIDRLQNDPLTEADVAWYLTQLRQLVSVISENKEFIVRCGVKIADVAWLGGNIYVLNLLKDNPEVLNAYLKSSVSPSGLAIVGFAFGPTTITMRVDTLDELDEILKRYNTGQLKEDFGKVLITEELKNLANGQRIELTVQLDEEKIMAIRKLLVVEEETTETTSHNALIKAYMETEEYDYVILHFKKVLSIAQQSGDKEAEIEAYKMMGKAHLKNKEYDEAISYSEKCLTIAQKSGNKKAEMSMYNLLGEAHSAKEEYDDAILYSEKCLPIAQESGDKVTEMNAYTILGRAHLEKDEYDDAISYYQNALAIAQESGEKKEMELYLALGVAYWKIDKYDDAFSCFTKGKTIATDLQDDHLISLFDVFFSIIYEEVGIDMPNEDESVQNAFLDAAGSASIFQRDTLRWITSYISYTHCRRDHDYEQAISHLKEAESTVATTQHGDGSIQCRKRLWLCKNDISEMHVLLGQYDKGLQYQKEALDVAPKKSRKAKSHFDLGNIYYKLEQLDNAEKSLEESLKYYELMFDGLKQNDRFKIAFVDKYKTAYKMLLKVLIETKKKEEALVLSDRYRAKALKDLLVSSYGVKEEPIARDVLQLTDIQSLVSSRNYSLLLYSRCFDKLGTFLVEAGNELEFSVQNFEYCDKCLDKLVNQAFADMKVRQVVNCAVGSLDVLDDSEENRNPKEDELTLSLTRQIEKSLSEQCRSICGCRGEPSENSDESSLTGLENLYNKLIEKIKCLIKQDEIVIIPEGPLCKVPFAALRDPETGQYLSETKRIRMAPSMATLKLLQEYPEEHHSSKDALIIGNPLVGRVILNEVRKKISPLPGALDEAIDIARILGVQPLLAADATKPAVIKRLQEGASVVHIAAHGILSKATIVLAPSPEIRAIKIPDEEDYMLTMADVQQAQVRAQLVVLSCCYSGRGQIKAEGVVGMCRAFLASGARAVVGSLWSISDKATLKFMVLFYQYLKKGQSASTSLHLTMNDMRRTPEYSDPKYWAPFFLMGDDVTIKFEDERSEEDNETCIEEIFL